MPSRIQLKVTPHNAAAVIGVFCLGARRYLCRRLEVLRVEGNDCFIKGQDGKEVRLHIDTVTLKARNIEPGERIEAKVDDQHPVIAILSNPAVTDRRNDKE